MSLTDEELLREQRERAEIEEERLFQLNPAKYIGTWADKWATTTRYSRMEVVPNVWIKATAALHVCMFGITTGIVPARFVGNNVDADTAALIDFVLKDQTFSLFFNL